MGSTHGRLILFLVVAPALPFCLLSMMFFVLNRFNNLYMITQEAHPFFKSVFLGLLYYALFQVLS